MEFSSLISVILLCTQVANGRIVLCHRRRCGGGGVWKSERWARCGNVRITFPREASKASVERTKSTIFLSCDNSIWEWAGDWLMFFLVWHRTSRGRKANSRLLTHFSGFESAERVRFICISMSEKKGDFEVEEKTPSTQGTWTQKPTGRHKKFSIFPFSLFSLCFHLRLFFSATIWKFWRKKKNCFPNNTEWSRESFDLFLASRVLLTGRLLRPDSLRLKLTILINYAASRICKKKAIEEKRHKIIYDKIKFYNFSSFCSLSDCISLTSDSVTVISARIRALPSHQLYENCLLKYLLMAPIKKVFFFVIHFHSLWVVLSSFDYPLSARLVAIFTQLNFPFPQHDVVLWTTTEQLSDLFLTVHRRCVSTLNKRPHRLPACSASNDNSHRKAYSDGRWKSFSVVVWAKKLLRRELNSSFFLVQLLMMNFLFSLFEIHQKRRSDGGGITESWAVWATTR